ncbi:hypothetical protein BV898_12764 [Hypsibius exemplaris]|uniref:Uncharacterized protein n=1 Tax=Hypsibius exemplaris TaxID=2072580 RepID=A0A1W0WCV0_HYPEX|nr:hypothetical protein BV898_12764 [Hypsibius exemplaris]
MFALGAVSSSANDIKRRLFLADRHNLKFLSGRSQRYEQTSLRKKFANFQTAHTKEAKHRDTRRDFLPNGCEFQTLLEQSKATIGVFVQNLEELPIIKTVAADMTPVPDLHNAPMPLQAPAGLDMDFSLIADEVRTSLGKHVRRVRNAGPRSRKRVESFPYRPPVAERVVAPHRWTPEVEESYRFQKAGYQDETHFRMLHGFNTKIVRWKFTGFIKMLPDRRNKIAFTFSNKRECRLCQLVRVRLHQYSWHFLLNDFRRVAAFQLRFAAVQKEGLAAAEKKRTKLVQQLELEEEARRANEQQQWHHHHHRHTPPKEKLEEEKSTKTKKPVTGRHHHKK